MAARKMVVLGIVCATLCVFLQGCAFNVRSAKLTAEPFVPPTALPISPTLPSSEFATPSTNTSADCTNSLSYIQDLTIPDGTQVEAGASIDKRWEVMNSGTCNWGEGYTIRLVAGSALGAPTEQTLFPARSSSKAVIQIAFTAPMDSDTYSSSWQAYDPNGQPFGDLIFIEIIVP
jgi:hypothetical protein